MYLKIVLSSQVHAEKMVKIQAGISVYIFPEVLPPIAECQMPAAPEVQASKTVNSLVWTNPMKVLQYQWKKPTSSTWGAILKVRGRTHWLCNFPSTYCETQNMAGNQCKSDLLFCSYFPSTAIFIWSRKLFTQPWEIMCWCFLVLYGWNCFYLYGVFLWANKCSYVTDSVLSIGAAITLLSVRPDSITVLQLGKAYRLLVTDNKESSVIEDTSTGLCFCSVPHSFT